MSILKRLLESGNHEDILIARSIILGKYKKKLKQRVYCAHSNLYLLGYVGIEGILETRLNLSLIDKLSINFEFTKEELYESNT